MKYNSKVSIMLDNKQNKKKCGWSGLIVEYQIKKNPVIIRNIKRKTTTNLFSLCIMVNLFRTQRQYKILLCNLPRDAHNSLKET